MEPTPVPPTTDPLLAVTQDDYHARKMGAKFASGPHNGTWGDLRGIFWHPSAYAALGNCRRNHTRVPYAEIIHAKLQAEVWNKA